MKMKDEGLSSLRMVMNRYCTLQPHMESFSRNISLLAETVLESAVWGSSKSTQRHQLLRQRLIT
jgi:hypothetical protein